MNHRKLVKESLFRTLVLLIDKQLDFELCRTSVYNGIDLIASDRETTKIEALLSGGGTNITNIFTISTIFQPIERNYDVILFDCAPSITSLQSSALLYAQKMFIPVSMEMLAVYGAGASIQGASMMNAYWRDCDIKVVALLPVMVDRRLQTTRVTLELPRRRNLWVISPGSARQLAEEPVEFPTSGIEGAL